MKNKNFNPKVYADLLMANGKIEQQNKIIKDLRKELADLKKMLNDPERLADYIGGL